ncbi:hypothetical protein HYV84_05900 [Candidatus Woesearchaeota archaeon]|nr:hypothetical protein [Candidatus Woesearchaeota archaeon]
MWHYIAYGLHMNSDALAEAIRADSPPMSRKITVTGFQRHFGAVKLLPGGGKTGRAGTSKNRGTICTITKSAGYSFNGIIYALDDSQFEQLITEEASFGFSPVRILPRQVSTFPQCRNISFEGKKVSFAAARENVERYQDPNGVYLDSLIAAAKTYGEGFFQEFIETTYLADRKQTIKQRYGNLIREG